VLFIQVNHQLGLLDYFGLFVFQKLVMVIIQLDISKYLLDYIDYWLVVDVPDSFFTILPLLLKSSPYGLT